MLNCRALWCCLTRVCARVRPGNVLQTIFEGYEQTTGRPVHLIAGNRQLYSIDDNDFVKIEQASRNCAALTELFAHELTPDGRWFFAQVPGGGRTKWRCMPGGKRGRREWKRQ